ncbi:Abi family protein [Flaviflexus massiliensis]|uniref:Abi family protein n=1 Tax=Flaviflexus massiliensis TaxID=1522309 RepID=UPI00097D7DAB
MAQDRRGPRPRGTQHYTKPPLALDELVARLASRGLVIPDRDRALRYLRHIGYYRLSPYSIPFQIAGSDHLFRTGTSFDNILDLYVFDRYLRLLVMDALERIEVAVRAAITDRMSTTYRDSHWYISETHFQDQRRHQELLRIVQQTGVTRLHGTPEKGEDRLVHRSALEHYLTTYGFPELPPSWLMVETLTIGQLTNMYRNLSRRQDRTNIARKLGITEPLLDSWMQTYVRVRNICAHHGRLWNVGLGNYPKIPTSTQVSWLDGEGALPESSRKRLYPVMVSLQVVLNTISPKSSWAQRLQDLLITRPNMNLRGMGFPEDWATNPFWRGHIA